MFTNNELLIMSAARLYSLGIDLEGAREELRRMVKANISYNCPKMQAAYTNFKELDEQWKNLEAEHLKLKADMKRAR